MKKDEVEVGSTYLAKVGRRMVEVRIERENGRGGWDASSVATGKPIRLKDPKHLCPAGAAEEPASDDEATDPDVVPLSQLDAERKRAGKSKRKGTSKAAVKTPKEPKPTKAEKPAKAPKPDAKPKAMSCLDAAAAVLKGTGEPMNCKAMVEAMAERGLWKSDAPTPAATLSSAILREMKKGDASRFRKADRGLFALTEAKGD